MEGEAGFDESQKNMAIFTYLFPITVTYYTYVQRCGYEMIFFGSVSDFLDDSGYSCNFNEITMRYKLL
jgi:hypothetical protein